MRTHSKPHLVKTMFLYPRCTLYNSPCMQGLHVQCYCLLCTNNLYQAHLQLCEACIVRPRLCVVLRVWSQHVFILGTMMAELPARNREIHHSSCSTQNHQCEMCPHIFLCPNIGSYFGVAISDDRGSTPEPFVFYWGLESQNSHYLLHVRTCST